MGLSQKDYCKKEGLKSTTFSYWRRVFKSNNEVLKTTFQEVKPKEEKSDNVSPLLQVKLPNGVMIAVSSAIETPKLLKLLNGLGRL